MKHGVESMVIFLYQNGGDFTGNGSMSMSIGLAGVHSIPSIQRNPHESLWVTLVPFQDEHIKTSCIDSESLGLNMDSVL